MLSRLSNFKCTDVPSLLTKFELYDAIKVERASMYAVFYDTAYWVNCFYFCGDIFVIFCEILHLCLSSLCVNCVLHYLCFSPTLLLIRPLAQYQSVACVFVVHIDRTDRGRMFSLFALHCSTCQFYSQVYPSRHFQSKHHQLSSKQSILSFVKRACQMLVELIIYMFEEEHHFSS